MAAIVYITEFNDLSYAGSGGVGQVAGQPANTLQTPITASGASQQSAAFNANTRFVRLKTDGGGPINFVFGTNPTAVAATQEHMSANQTEYYSVPQGQAFKVAVIVSAA